MRLRLKTSDFANIVLNFLLDKLMHPEDVIETDINPEFNAFMEALDRKGVKALLLKYYMSPENREYRVLWKRIRGVFTEDRPPDTVQFVIERDERPEEEKKGPLKKFERLVKKFVGEV